MMVKQFLKYIRIIFGIMYVIVGIIVLGYGLMQLYDDNIVVLDILFCNGGIFILSSLLAWGVMKKTDIARYFILFIFIACLIINIWDKLNFVNFRYCRIDFIFSTANIITLAIFLPQIFILFYDELKEFFTKLQTKWKNL